MFTFFWSTLSYLLQVLLRNFSKFQLFFSRKNTKMHMKKEKLTYLNNFTPNSTQATNYWINFFSNFSINERFFIVQRMISTELDC